MFGLFISSGIYERVMNNSSIKNKRLGYFWREALLYFCIFLLVFAFVFFMSGNQFWQSLSLFKVSVVSMIVLIVCTLVPLLHYQTVSKEFQQANEKQ